MEIKHIFTDMDGTLLNARGALAETDRWAIYYSNLPITLVSSRSPIEMQPVIEQLQLSSPQVAFNGNLTFIKNRFGIEILDKHILSPTLVTQLLDFIEKEYPQISLSWYSMTHWYIKKQDKAVFYKKALTGMEPKLKHFEGQSEIYKIMMMSFNPADLEKLQEALDHLDLENVTIRRADAYTLEITSNIGSKVAAAQQILLNEKLTFEESAAIGDSINDLSLLQAVGFGIAVENASPSIKAHVKMVVAKNTEHGVAEALSAIHDFNE